MAERARATEAQGESGGERPTLAFIDHDRQEYADRVAIAGEGEFLIGDYLDGGGVGDLGEFRILLHYLGDRRGMLQAQLWAFGDGAGALALLMDLVGGDLRRLLSPVKGHKEFSRRLLDLGLRDASNKPLEESR